MTKPTPNMAQRFRGYLPVVVDVETAGFDNRRDALLEVAAVLISMDENGICFPSATIARHVLPFEGANLNKDALAFTGIDPYHPFRNAVSEREALQDVFGVIRKEIKLHQCKRAIMVGHNTPFDLGFIQSAVYRCKMKRNPFHPFSTIDTVSLAALALGHTVLSRAMELANIEFDKNQAHTAIYDAEKTAELFCFIVNKWQTLGGWQWLEESEAESEAE